MMMMGINSTFRSQYTYPSIAVPFTIKKTSAYVLAIREAATRSR